MTITTGQILELRQLTGEGVMDCKRALEASEGDFARARALLAEAAEKEARKKAEREVKAGIVDSYIHNGGRVGVLIEVHCETDFLSESPEFRRFVRELALQIASEAPQYVGSEDVPPELIREIERQAEENARATGKPERAILQMKEGKVRKFLSRACLLEQAFIKDPEITVGALVNRFVAKSGENVQVCHFTRYQIPK